MRIGNVEVQLLENGLKYGLRVTVYCNGRTKSGLPVSTYQDFMEPEKAGTADALQKAIGFAAVEMAERQAKIYAATFDDAEIYRQACEALRAEMKTHGTKQAASRPN